MKYFTLAGLALFGLAAAAPKPQFNFDAENNEDCVEEYDSAYDQDDLIGTFSLEEEDGDCLDEGVEDSRPFAKIEIPDQPAYSQEDEFYDAIQNNFGIDSNADTYDEECEEEEVVFEEAQVDDFAVHREEEPEEELADCYDEDSYPVEYNDLDNNENSGNLEDILDQSQAAFSDLDEIIQTDDFSVQSMNEPFDECIEY